VGVGRRKLKVNPEKVKNRKEYESTGYNRLAGKWEGNAVNGTGDSFTIIRQWE